MPSQLQQEVDHRLASFEGHGLADLKNAALMNRVDTKFICAARRVPELLEALDGSYSALQIAGNRSFRYRSTYYDTEDLRFYKMHHCGHLNRHKVRLREYLDSRTRFLEVKFKNNKSRTIKQRIELKDPKDDFAAYRSFLQQAGLPHEVRLQPALVNGYQRLALASEARGERLTIDFGLQNTCVALEEDAGRMVCLDELAIIELKQSRLDRSSPFFALARRFNLKASGFSKYCMGMTFTLQDSNLIKYNRFKKILRRVDSLYSTELCA